MKNDRHRITLDLTKSELPLFEQLPQRKWASLMRLILRDAIRSKRAEQVKIAGALDFDEIPHDPIDGDVISGTQPVQMSDQMHEVLSPGAEEKLKNQSTVNLSIGSKSTGQTPPEAASSTVKQVLSIPVAATAELNSNTPRAPAGPLLKNFFGQNPNTNEISP